MTSDALGEKLRITIRDFFLNNPLPENKKIMWDLYTNWVY
jgi:hypothetical protein